MIPPLPPRAGVVLLFFDSPLTPPPAMGIDSFDLTGVHVWQRTHLSTQIENPSGGSPSLN